MTKNEFMRELGQKLKRLPQKEMENAMRYYEEYFDDAGKENEHKVLQELGSPAAVAAKIIGEYAANDLEEKTVWKSRPIWIVLLTIFASPIALPLALTVVLVAVVLILALGLIFLSLGITFIAIALTGLAALVSGFGVMAQSMGTGLFFVGLGLLCIVVGVAAGLGISKVSKITFLALQRVLGKFLIRKGAQMS